MKKYLVIMSVVALSVACGDDGGGGDGNGPDAAPAQTVSIQDIQDDAMAVGTSVQVSDVVVTAVDAYGGRVGAIYVQEPEGGAFSGVVVNTSAVPSGVEVGSIVTVSGFKDEFALTADTTGRTVTQIGSPTVTVTGSGSVPAPEVLDPRTLANDDIEAEKWEGVLVTFENVAFEGLPRGVTDTDELLLEARVTGPFRVQSGLAAFPEGIAYRDCYSSITGIGDYFFDYKILPRTAADFGSAGTGCPEEEAMCTNTTDDDGDGFADCEDFNCYAVADIDTCTADHTVIQIQDDTVAVDTTVQVSGVVTAVGRDRDEIWIQTAGADGDPHDGLHVEAFRSVLTNDEIDTDIVIGRTVTVQGIRRDSFGETIVGNANIVDDEGTATPHERDDAVAADIASTTLTNGAQYEGQLVTFSDIDVTAVGMFGQFTLEGGLIVDDSLFSYTQPSGTCTYDSITGIVMLNTFDDFYYLAPRQSDDLGTCTN